MKSKGLALLVALTALLAPACQQAAPRTTTLRVEGMTCNSCVNAIQTKVGAMEGVIKVAVDLKAARATIEFRPGKTSAEALVKAIDGLGYKASIAGPPGPP